MVDAADARWTTEAGAGFPKTVGSSVPTVQKTGRYTGQTGRFIEVSKFSHDLGWEPDRFVYRAGPVPCGTGRTTGFANPEQGWTTARLAGAVMSSCSGDIRLEMMEIKLLPCQAQRIQQLQSL
jgi:hypothetical protein